MGRGGLGSSRLARLGSHRFARPRFCVVMAKLYRLLDAERREYLSPVPGELGGHRRNRIYGRLDCPSALRWLAKGHIVKHRIFFADEPTAIAAGYRPCAVCMREEPSLEGHAGLSRARCAVPSPRCPDFLSSLIFEPRHLPGSWRLPSDAGPPPAAPVYVGSYGVAAGIGSGSERRAMAMPRCSSYGLTGTGNGGVFRATRRRRCSRTRPALAGSVRPVARSSQLLRLSSATRVNWWSSSARAFGTSSAQLPAPAPRPRAGSSTSCSPKRSARRGERIAPARGVLRRPRLRAGRPRRPASARTRLVGSHRLRARGTADHSGS